MNSIKTDSAIQKLTPEATFDEIIAANPNALHLLLSIGLDPNAHADKTLRQVCSKKQWNEVELLEWIKKNPPATQIKNDVEIFKKKRQKTSSGVSEICGFLIEKTLPEIEELSSQIRSDYMRVAKIHGIQYPWLNEAKWHVNQFLNTLQYFLKFERETFFPLAIELQERGQRMLDGNVQNLKRSLTVVRYDHGLIEEKMQRINKISNQFHFDESACSSFRILCNRLETFFDLLAVHINIESKYLLPEIEKKLSNS